MEFQSVGYESILGGQNNCPYTGKEKKKRIDRDTLVYYDEYGSFRFIHFINGSEQASAIQVMFTKEPKLYQVANVFTVEKHRRKGFATKLFKKAEKYFKNEIIHSSNLSPLGKSWVNSIKKLTL